MVQRREGEKAQRRTVLVDGTLFPFTPFPLFTTFQRVTFQRSNVLVELCHNRRDEFESSVWGERVLISTVALWAFAGVAGVAMTAALILHFAARLLPERRGSGSWVAWLVIGAGAAIGFSGILWGGLSVAFGEALIASGLVMLALVMEPSDSDGGRHIVGWTITALVFLAAGALKLPPVAWRGLFGIVIFLTAMWLAVRARGDDRRPVFDLAVAPIAFAGIGLMLGVIRPSFVVASDAAIGLLLVGGFATLAAATVVSLTGTEINTLQGKLAGLEDEHDHLLRLAESDPLTGCPTRQALRAWFERWEGGEPVSVVLIDVDELKRINDRHGHDAGDEALRLVAGVLKGSIRPGDLVVRWGGDEFVAVLRGAGHDAAKRRFTGLIGGLEEATADFPYPEPLRVNWGVASCVAPSDISRALAEADERMYAMKRRRRHEASSDGD
jgi:diguanylate cyclase (GGDEF)-like protein